MMAAVKTGNVPFASHLEKCEPCRQLFELLSHLTGVESELTEPQSSDCAVPVEYEPSLESVYRHRAIARLVESRHPARTIGGLVVYDSWANLPAVQVRDALLEGERRMRLKAGRFTLELIGDRQLEQWEFVARVYDRTKVTPEFILQVGRKKLYARSQNCFFWSAKRPPRKVQLLSPSTRIDFGTLKW